MKLTRIKTFLVLTLALASGYCAFAQRNNNNNNNDYFGGGGRNNNGNFGRGQRNNNGYFGSTQSSIVPPGSTNYDRFAGFISQRNIFNPDRFAASVQPANYRPPTQRPRSVPTFGLVGTMAYEKGMFAFFDGNNPEYQKVLYTSDTNYIAGFIVADITTSGAKLQTADKKQAMTLKIGDTLQQQNDGTWDIGGSPGSFSSGGGAGFMAASSAGGSSATLSTEPGAEPDAAAAPAAPSAAVSGNDILRRLMQERQQQLK